jgi:hypothetical protein
MLSLDYLQPQDARTYFETLFYTLHAEERVELRYKKPGSAYMRRAFFDDPIEAAGEAVLYGRVYDAYAGVAPRFEEVGTRQGISRVLAVWADLDAKGEHTLDSRLAQLAALNHHPSMVVASGGGGVHPYWLLREPAQTAAEIEYSERVMKRLGTGLEGDPVHDRTRILRVPGTYNHKYGARKPVRLLVCSPGARYTLDQISQMADSLPNPRDDKSKASGGYARKSLEGVLKEPVMDGQRNVTMTRLAGSLRYWGLDEESMLVVLLALNDARFQPPLPESEVQGVAKSVGRYESKGGQNARPAVGLWLPKRIRTYAKKTWGAQDD